MPQSAISASETIAVQEHRSTIVPTSGSAFEAGYLTQLDGLRTLAFSMVFFHHAGKIPDVPGFAWLIDPINHVMAWGHLGVDVFFVLSGFLITRLLLKERQKHGNFSLPHFYARRALRIWPVFYTVLFISCIAIPLIFWSETNHELFIGFLKLHVLPLFLFLGNYSWMLMMPGNPTVHLTIPHLTAAGYVIGPFWTLCIEEQFYLGWPLILSRLRQPRTIFAGIVFLTCFSIASRALFYKYSLTAFWALGPTFLYYVNTICRLDTLMIGALLAMLSVYHPQVFSIKKSTGAIIAIALAAAFGYVCAFMPSIYDPRCRIVALVFYAALGSGTLLYLALTWRPAIRLFSHPILADIGKITYCMYLIHYGILGLCRPDFTDLQYIPVAHSWLFQTFCAYLLTLLLAKLSWKFLEGPCNSLRHRFSRI